MARARVNKLDLITCFHELDPIRGQTFHMAVLVADGFVNYYYFLICYVLRQIKEIEIETILLQTNKVYELECVHEMKDLGVTIDSN